MYAYLTLLNGSRAGSNFILDRDTANRLGRGLDCHVVLTDPLSSRVHAAVVYRDGTWWLDDCQSLNGTLVNGQKADSVCLTDGCVVRIGSSEFAFHETDERPVDTSLYDARQTQVVIHDRPIDPHDVSRFGLSALHDSERGPDFLLLYQLCIKLVGGSDPDEVVRVALELVHERTGSAVTGFLWWSEDGELKSKYTIPADRGGTMRFSETLTELVCRQRHAVWIDNMSAGMGRDSLSHFADAFCVPLVPDKTVLGAMHLYREQGRFRQADFDFAISVANILGVALARTRRQALLAADHERLKARTADADDLLGQSPAVRELKARIARVAQATGCVLIRGESGAGKELVARALHRASPRADRPMLSVNCAAIPRELMESQLFGHKRGAFTGADADHVGWFQQADSGALFLDEVGELTPEGQAKLLRILEGHPFTPVGGTKEVRADVRVIAATNRDLSEFVREKRFREDLFYRLCVFELNVPPLRERGDDIDLLVDHFFEHFKLQHGRPALELSPAARRRLRQYRWPGNVRQLRNVIDSVVVLAAGPIVEPDDLGLRDPMAPEGFDTLRLEDWEARLIREALARTGNNMVESAQLLGIGRATLYRKLEQHGVER